MAYTVTDCISRHAIAQLINAFSFAENIKEPFTTFFYIAWNKTEEWTPDLLSARQEEFIRKLRAWFKREAIPFNYLFTVEDGPTLGIHSNFAVYLPQKDYRNKLVLFKKLISEIDTMIPGHIGNPTTVKFSRGKEPRPKWHWHINQRLGSLRYFMKGIDPTASFNVNGSRIRLCDHLGIRPSNEGIVIGPRHGVSHTLGTAARSAYGWKEHTTPDELLRAFPHLPKPEQVTA